MKSMINPFFDTSKPFGSFSSVAEGQEANVALATGGIIYDALHFEYPYSVVIGGEFTKAHMTLTVMLNEEAIVDHIPVADLIDMDTYRDIAETNGYFSLRWREVLAKTKDGDQIGSLVTMPNDNLVVIVKIEGTGAGAVVTLSGWSDLRESGGAQRRIIPKLKKQPYPADAGDNEVDGYAILPVYKRVWFNAADIEKVQVLTTEGVNESKIFDRTNARNNYVQKSFGRVPVAGWYVFDPVVDGYARSKVLNTSGKAGRLNALNFRVTKTAAGSMPMLVESAWPESRGG